MCTYYFIIISTLYVSARICTYLHVSARICTYLDEFVYVLFYNYLYSVRICTYMHVSARICTYLYVSVRIWTNLCTYYFIIICCVCVHILPGKWVLLFQEVSRKQATHTSHDRASSPCPSHLRKRTWGGGVGCVCVCGGGGGSGLKRGTRKVGSETPNVPSGTWTEFKAAART